MNIIMFVIIMNTLEIDVDPSTQISGLSRACAFFLRNSSTLPGLGLCFGAQAQWLRHVGSLVAAHGLCCPVARGILVP